MSEVVCLPAAMLCTECGDQLYVVPLERNAREAIVYCVNKMCLRQHKQFRLPLVVVDCAPVESDP